MATLWPWFMGVVAVGSAGALCPTTVRAGVPSRLARRAASVRAPVSVGVGATAGAATARTVWTAELADAIREEPRLRLADSPQLPATLVVTATVRSLTVQSGAASGSAQWDVGVVIANGGGVVQGTLDARGSMRGGNIASPDEIRHAAMRGAARTVVRNLVAQWVP